MITNSQQFNTLKW